MWENYPRVKSIAGYREHFGASGAFKIASVSLDEDLSKCMSDKSTGKTMKSN